jgi:hypothetical protein
MLQIAIVRSSEYSGALDGFRAKAERQAEILSSYEPDVLKAQLASAAQQVRRFFIRTLPLEPSRGRYTRSCRPVRQTC